MTRKIKYCMSLMDVAQNIQHFCVTEVCTTKPAFKANNLHIYNFCRSKFDHF